MTDSLASIITQLQSSDVKARSQALFQLQPDSVTNPTQAIELLVEVLTTEQDLNVLEDATWVLSRYQSAATASLLTQIQHPNPRIRHNIVHALGKVTDPAAVPALISASTDPDPIVRQKSVYALGQIGDTAAIDALIVSLDDATQEVKWTAREVLEKFGAQALPDLIQALKMPSAAIRELAANLLGELAHPDATDPLIAALDTDEWQIRFAILEALANSGDKRAISAIDPYRNDSQAPVRAMAERALKILNR